MQASIISRGLLTVLLFISGSTIGEAKTIPKEFTQCKLNDPKLDDCMRGAIQSAFVAMKNGLPDYQLLPIDPLTVTHMSLGLANTSKIDLSDVKLFGLSNIKIDSVKTDIKNRQIEFKASADELSMEADYEMDGKLKSLPLKGKGKAKLALTRPKSVFSFKADAITAADGNVYWNVTVFTDKFLETSNFKVHFDNLFNGDKTLGESTNKVLNDNWKELWANVGPQFEEGYAKILKIFANVLFSKIPEKNIFAR